MYVYIYIHNGPGPNALGIWKLPGECVSEHWVHPQMVILMGKMIIQWTLGYIILRQTHVPIQIE